MWRLKLLVCLASFEGVWEEAQYFQVESLLTALQPLMAEHTRMSAVNGALNRRDVVSALLGFFPTLFFFFY